MEEDDVEDEHPNHHEHHARHHLEHVELHLDHKHVHVQSEGGRSAQPQFEFNDSEVNN